MGSLIVRNVDDDLIARLKQRASSHGRSTEAEHREILRNALVGHADFDVLAKQIRALTAGREHTPSESLLRAMRDDR